MAPSWGEFLSPSNVVDFVKDIKFPCTKEDLITFAEDNDAPQSVLDKLHKLPDKKYNSIQDLTTTAAKSMV